MNTFAPLAGSGSPTPPLEPENLAQDVKKTTIATLPRRASVLSRHALLLAGIGIIGLVVISSVFADIIASVPPDAIQTKKMLQPPSASHLMGTDILGRDVFSRILHGGRVSLWVGLVAVGIATTIGILVGLVSGYFGGVVDEILMRLVDIMLCFPSFFLILAVIAFLEPSILNIMVVIGLTSWMGVARLVRAETISLRRRDFVLAARMAGAGRIYILIRHILPNALAPVLVSATLGVAGAILTESALSFLGLGVQPPDPSWGNMLMDGKEVLGVAPWLSVFPGLAILVTVLGYNLLGESLRDLLDPRLKQ